MSDGEPKLDAIVITGRGMVSSLGLDVHTSCAAARAGVTNAKELDYFKFCSLDTGQVESAIGHQVPFLTKGFEGGIRLVRLLEGALTDLQKNVADAPWLKGRTKFYLSLPSDERTQLIKESGRNNSELRDESELAKVSESIDIVTLDIIGLAAKLSGFCCKPLIQFVSYSGHTSALEALNSAKQDLEKHLVDYAVVGGADSFLDESTLKQLYDKGFLKTSDNAIGIQPAEAGAFVLLETANNAKTRGAHVLGVIENIQLSTEDSIFLSDAPCLGKGLTKAILELIKNFKKIADKPIWLISDHNGESCRAVELGNVAVNIKGQSNTNFKEIWYPALSFGETGGISGIMAILMVISAFDRGYSPGSMGIVVASDYETNRGAALISVF